MSERKIENVTALNKAGKIVASAWLFDPKGNRMMTEKQAIKFCSEGGGIGEIKMLTADEYRALASQVGWAND